MVEGSSPSLCSIDRETRTVSFFQSTKLPSVCCKMEDTREKWELALDTIADDIHAALGHAGPAGSPVPRPPTVHLWVDSLVAILVERQRENDPESESEVLDVLASLLRASADARWRERIAKEDGTPDGLYTKEKLEAMIEALVASVDSQAELAEVDALVIEIVSSLLLNASDEDEISSVLKVFGDRVQGTALETVLLGTHTPPSEEGSDGFSWPLCFLRFALLCAFVREKPTVDPSERATLRLLTGAGPRVTDWIADTWEKKWYLHRSTHIGEALFGSVEGCVTTIHRAIQGFSVGQDEPVETKAPSVASSVLAIRDIQPQRGLVHGIDVTIIKNGEVHPVWANSSRVICLEDVDHALGEGYTIGLRGVQARDLSILGLCDALQQELGQHVNANLYWTPSNQQGFDTHIDDHCVFAIQLKGRKRWVLYEAHDVLPQLYDDTGSLLARAPPRFDSEVTLEEGDVLYIPRGVAHHADTRDIDEESIHLTIGTEIETRTTKARIIEEIQKHSVKLRCDWSEVAKRKGLMMWHLSEETNLITHIAALAGHPLDDATSQSVASIQTDMKRERDASLKQRALYAWAMAKLHEAAHLDHAVTTCGERSDSTQPNIKKQRT